ncbi:hypothetical protein O3G_MSEX004767 [Manduca sexta]|uniref:Uncharacterized protein n=2 Tax=Manduca sexta TaxID=7130 RepID=A0A921YY74_MANSE|nr:hypothetical protein O3G_MSEX004767 [Manduca sexta]
MDREKMKEKLANLMTYGDNDNQIVVPSSPCFGSKPLPKLPTSKDMKKELINQICERMKWLAEMECLGQAEPHKIIINDQIAERIRALDALGIDTEGSSARSTASGFSTTRSREQLQLNKPLTKNGTSSACSMQRKVSVTPVLHVSRSNREENVASYGQLPSLQYSPRRRV